MYTRKEHNLPWLFATVHHCKVMGWQLLFGVVYWFETEQAVCRQSIGESELDMVFISVRKFRYSVLALVAIFRVIVLVFNKRKYIRRSLRKLPTSSPPQAAA